MKYRWGILILATLLTSLSLSPRFTLNPLPRVSFAGLRQIRFNLTLSNPSSRPLTGQKLWFHLPMDIPGKQELTTVTVSWPSQRIEDDTGQNRLRLDFEDFPPFALKTVSISIQLAMSTTGAAQLLEQPELWLKEEKYIEVADPIIQKQAQALKARAPKESAYQIYTWVGSQLQYSGYMPENKGAVYALQHQSGDCTEYASLVVALARANRIPARLISGYVLGQDAVVNATDYHDWAELYFDDKWQLVDAQRGNWLTSEEQYIAFQIQGLESPNQPSDFEGRFNLPDELKLSY